jgi:hypothetical protein
MKTRSRGINLVLLLGGTVVSGLLTGHLLSRLSSLPDEAALLSSCSALVGSPRFFIVLLRRFSLTALYWGMSEPKNKCMKLSRQFRVKKF